MKRKVKCKIGHEKSEEKGEFGNLRSESLCFKGGTPSMLECYKIHFERVARKMIIILNKNLVEFLYSLGLEFMAPSVNNM